MELLLRDHVERGDGVVEHVPDRAAVVRRLNALARTSQVHCLAVATDSFEMDLDKLARGLAVMDTTAISMCMDNDLPIIVFNLNVPGNLKRVVLGEHVGTLVTA